MENVTGVRSARSFFERTIAAAVLIGLAGPVAAQKRQPPRFAESPATRLAAQGQRPARFAVFPAMQVAARAGSFEASDSVGEPGVGRLILGGIGFGALGAGVGAAMGALAGGGRTCGDDRCSLVLGMFGFAVGEAVGIPLGVHLAGGRRGVYAAEVVASMAAGGAGLLAFKVTPAAAVAIPVAQIFTSVVLEKALRI